MARMTNPVKVVFNGGEARDVELGHGASVTIMVNGRDLYGITVDEVKVHDVKHVRVQVGEWPDGEDWEVRLHHEVRLPR